MTEISSSYRVDIPTAIWRYCVLPFNRARPWCPNRLWRNDASSYLCESTLNLVLFSSTVRAWTLVCSRQNCNWRLNCLCRQCCRHVFNPLPQDHPAAVFACQYGPYNTHGRYDAREWCENYYQAVLPYGFPSLYSLVSFISLFLTMSESRSFNVLPIPYKMNDRGGFVFTAEPIKDFDGNKPWIFELPPDLTQHCTPAQIIVGVQLALSARKPIIKKEVEIESLWMNMRQRFFPELIGGESGSNKLCGFIDCDQNARGGTGTYKALCYRHSLRVTTQSSSKPLVSS